MCGRTPPVSIQRESVSVPHRNDRQTGQRAVSRNAYGTHALRMSSHLSWAAAKLPAPPTLAALSPTRSCPVAARRRVGSEIIASRMFADYELIHECSQDGAISPHPKRWDS